MMGSFYVGSRAAEYKFMDFLEGNLTLHIKSRRPNNFILDTVL